MIHSLVGEAVYFNATMPLDLDSAESSMVLICLDGPMWQAKLRRGKTVYYSYEACGSNDTFTLSYNKILGRSRGLMHWDTGQLLLQNSTGSKVSRHIITHTQLYKYYTYMYMEMI